MHESWRCYKSLLKATCFDDKSHDEAIKKRPSHIPEDMWENLVSFWESDKGKARSQRGAQNRGNNKMCHHAGSKSFARVRAEEEAKGNDTSKLSIWLKTHEPKKGSKLDDASYQAKQAIENELAHMEESACDGSVRDEIFNKVIGEDKNGYAKTFGIGKKVPRSNSKRCALEEERAKRIKVEKVYKESQEKIQILEKNGARTERKLGHVTELLKLLLQRQGVSKDILASLDMDDDEDHVDDVNNDDIGSKGYGYEPNDEHGEGFDDFGGEEYV